MKKEIYKELITESLKDEVNVSEEWNRLLTSITKTSRKNRFPIVLRYAAAVFAGICISITSGLLLNDKPDDSVNQYTTITEKGEKSTIILPDGTTVKMNVATTIQYSSEYGKKNRDIYIDGEAFFEVANNPRIPFIVKANGVDVTALGTSFNVSAYAVDANVTTTLFSGEVSVKHLLTGQQILLHPNQVAIYYKDNNRIETKSYEENKYAQWRGKAFAFEMIALDELTTLLERKYNITFDFRSAKLKNLKFNGQFENDESLADILKIIKINTSANYKIENDTVIFE